MNQIFDLEKEEHVTFVKVIEALDARFVELLSPGVVMPMLKKSPQNEHCKILYSKLETETVAEGKVKLCTVMKGFEKKQHSDYFRTFLMTGSLKVIGMCDSSKGLAYMKRISEINYQGVPEDSCIVIDMTKEVLTVDVTHRASMKRPKLEEPDVAEWDREEDHENSKLQGVTLDQLLDLPEKKRVKM